MTLLHYESIPINESCEPLVDLGEYDFVLEPVYFKQGLSDDQKMYLRKSVADKLLKIQEKLGGYKFKIWDGWRSRKVQNSIYEKYWNDLKEKHPDWNDEKLRNEVGIFVTDAKNPNKIPPHATGSTVDLTLVDENGNELDMGTVFDHFGPEAASYYFEENNVSEQVKKNRKILRDAMTSENFSIDKDEWWHFDFDNQKWAKELGKCEASFGEVYPS
ncbi:MAG TPA: M15 family metallopeptidase [Candidatus Paceibacterota bacterium]